MPSPHQILGIPFFGGTSREAVEEITRRGGLLVAPAAPSMITLCKDAGYRRAVLSAEIAIADSGFMVLLWKFFTGESLPRISGLEHVKRLLEHPSMANPAATVWVVATETSRVKLIEYLEEKEEVRSKKDEKGKAESGKRKAETQKPAEKDEGAKAENGKLKAEMEKPAEKDEGAKAESGKRKAEMQNPAERKGNAAVRSDFRLPTSDLRPLNSDLRALVYVAPKYGRPVVDEALLALVREKHPLHIVIAVGGGIQDQLGEYLLERLDYRPAVHCIGAALGFITGDQVRIPDWADKYYLGWFFRSVAQPKVFVPRFWSARRLPWLIWKYRERLPPVGA